MLSPTFERAPVPALRKSRSDSSAGRKFPLTPLWAWALPLLAAVSFVLANIIEAPDPDDGRQPGDEYCAVELPALLNFVRRPRIERRTFTSRSPARASPELKVLRSIRGRPRALRATRRPRLTSPALGFG